MPGLACPPRSDVRSRVTVDRTFEPYSARHTACAAVTADLPRLYAGRSGSFAAALAAETPMAGPVRDRPSVVATDERSVAGELLAERGKSLVGGQGATGGRSR
ncbi:MAG: hypothetical protein GX344_07900, partial [Intrasporangiaceae bacterium]|nr:hypothetical protein [Intrasporangiaceae bacterium]